MVGCYNWGSNKDKHADEEQGVVDRLLSFIYVCKKESDLCDIGKEIESLKGRVMEIKNKREEYGIINILAIPMGQQRKRTLLRATSFENLVDLIGFEDDFNTLLAELVRDDPSLKMISIHGMGGLGKTTLVVVSKLYHSSMLSHFVSRAWVCVSQEYNTKDVLKSIIKSFLGNELDLLNMDEVDLLRRWKSYEDWSNMKDSIWRELKGDSVQIQEILSLSYDDLSFPVRQCFLYLARFPEDHVIDIHMLKLLWIAEEFITEDDEGDGVGMEDVAEDYLNELIYRNMTQISKSFWDGQVYECQVHDLVRDLAMQKATEKKLLGIIDSSKQHPIPVSLLREQPRHVIYNGIGKYLELLEPNSDDLKLRSLALINQCSRLFRLQKMKVMYTGFKYVKVLDLRGVESEGIAKEIGDLVLLKFLGLVGGHISSKPLVIPRTIGKLKKLQTLCGSFGFNYEFPRDICELRESRHLSFFQGKYGGSLRIGSKQTKLQSLKYIRYDDWILIDTKYLTNLHTLVISEDESKERNAACSLESTSNLTSLKLFKYNTNAFIPTIKPLSSCKRLNKVFLYGKIRDPSELSSLPDSVTYLTLSSSEFIRDPMPTLGSLSNLTGLIFKYNVYMGKEMVCSQDAFPSRYAFSQIFSNILL